MKCPKCGHQLPDDRLTVAKRKAQKSYTRAFEPWTPEEDAALEAYAGAHKTLLEIAGALERQPSAVLRRATLFQLQISPPALEITPHPLTWAEKEAEDLKKLEKDE